MENDAAKKLFLEQAAAYYDELKASSFNASYGKKFASAEHFAVVEGHELLRKSLEHVTQESADDVDNDEKKTAKRVLAAERDAIAEGLRKPS